VVVKHELFIAITIIIKEGIISYVEITLKQSIIRSNKKNVISQCEGHAAVIALLARLHYLVVDNFDYTGKL